MTLDNYIKMYEIWASDSRISPNIREEHKQMVEWLKDYKRLLEQEPCKDYISRQQAIDKMQELEDEDIKAYGCKIPEGFDGKRAIEALKTLQPVTPNLKIGHWMRMSDLSEQEDDRYKCSHCGNVIHYKDKMNLYTFNSWCGRCGSDNGRKQADILYHLLTEQMTKAESENI